MKTFDENTNPLKGFRYKSLPAVLIKDNFVKGDEFSYEDWMLEYANQSKHFLNLSAGEHYIKPKSQSDKECDCITKQYQFDCKRLISSSFMHALSLTSNQIIKQPNGFVVECGPLSEETMDYYVIEKICRFTEFKEFQNTDLIQDLQHRKCVNDIMNVIMKKKNIVCMFPMFVKNDNSEAVSFDKAMLYLNLCYSDLFKTRYKRFPSFESYVCFFYEDDYIITKFNGTQFIFLESIEKTKSPTYLRARSDSGYPLFSIL